MKNKAIKIELFNSCLFLIKNILDIVIMKYLIIIIIFFTFILYYNLLLSRKNILLKQTQKKYKNLKRKFKLKDSKKSKLIIDESIYNNSEDSIFSNELDDNIL
jgi:uncharacterized protein YxeA